MVGLQFQGVSLPVGDEGVIAVAGEERQLGTGRRLHPPDDEPHRRGVGLTLEGRVVSFSHVGGAVHPVGDRRPVRLGYVLDDVAQPGVLADGDGVADIRLSAGGHHGVGVAAAVGAHGELPAGPAVAHPAHRLPQEVGGAPRRGPRAAETSARRRYRRQWPAAGDSPAGRCSRGGAPLP